MLICQNCKDAYEYVGPPGPQPNIEPFINQMQQAAGGEKGPSPDPFSYMQAQVGPVGPRGSAGKPQHNF